MNKVVSCLKSSYWTDVTVVNGYCNLHTDLHKLFFITPPNVNMFIRLVSLTLFVVLKVKCAVTR